MATEFKGAGWAYPPRFELAAATVATVRGDEDIEQSLEILLRTRRGTHPLDLDYGTDLDSWAFAEMDDATVEGILSMLARSIRSDEPRIWVESVIVETKDPQSGRLEVRVDYVVRDTNSRASRVFPFYLKEGTNL